MIRYFNDSGIRRYTLWMSIALVIDISDELTKLAIVDFIDLYGKVSLASFLNLTHQHNYGAAFSFLANAGGWQRWFFVALASIVSAVLREFGVRQIV